MSDASTGDAIFEEMGNAASVMCYFGSCFPGATELGVGIPRGIGGPCGIGEASGKWQDGASALQDLQQTLQQLTGSLSEADWSGDDRTGFDKEVSDLLAEFGDSHDTAETIGITLEVLPPFFAVWPTMSLTMGIGIATIAACFYAETASVVGDLGASEATYALGEAFTTACTVVMGVSTAVLVGLLAATQAVIVGAVAVDIDTQQKHGNKDILGDLGQAEVDGLGEVVTNAAQIGISFGLDKPAGKFGGEQAEVPEVLGGVLGGLVRGEGHNSRAIAHALTSQVDVAQHQTVERTHAGESLQDLINDMSGWDEPTVPEGEPGSSGDSGDPGDSGDSGDDG